MGVPDWSRAPAGIGMGFRYYQSAGDSLPMFAFSADGQQLTLGGIYIDEIVIRERPTVNYRPIDIQHNPKRNLEVFSAIRGLYAQIRARPLVQINARESAKELFFQAVMFTSAMKLHGNQEIEWFRDLFEEWFALIADDTLTTEEDLQTTRYQFSKRPVVEYERLSFLVRVGAMVPGKAYFITGKGYVDQSTYDIQVGDLLVIFAGMTVPCVIRRVKRGDFEESSYIFVGPAYYAHGIMFGEVWDERSGHLEEFTLV